MKFLCYRYNNYGGIEIRDDISQKTITYYDYSLKEAIRQHRRNFGLVGKHFTIIEV